MKSKALDYIHDFIEYRTINTCLLNQNTGAGSLGDLVYSTPFLSSGNICHPRCDNSIVSVKLVIRCIKGVPSPVVLGTLERDELFYFFGMAKNLVFHRKVVLHRSLD